MLAERLQAFRGERAVVLGLARGGIPVAQEVARAIGAPLEAMVVLPLAAAEAPDFELGAIAEGGGAYVDPDALLEAGLRDDDVEAIAEREGRELARRVRSYRGGRPPRDLAGATAIVVDDGVAKGATQRAAARAARRAGATQVVLAAPVVAAERVPDLRADFDEVVAIELPDPLVSVGVWYERFAPVCDGDVVAALGGEGTGAPEVGAGATPVTADTSSGAGTRYPRRE